ncbi:MAG: hypothetical protein E7610_05940 [Ruminococcaceae bacterium]|nr:hypothetical protein [Oscillospiraceae bacterium]
MRSLPSISAEAFFMELLNMALLATWIMLAVLLFRAILKRWLPRRVVILGWLLVAIRLVCPVTLESVLSLIPGGEPIPPDMPYSNTPAIHVGVPIIDQPVNNLLTEHMTPAPGDSVNPLQIVFLVGFMVWAMGVAALLIYMAVSYVLLRRRVRTAVKISADVTTARTFWKVTLWQSEAVASPFILGLFKPRIYLPYGMDPETTAHVLAHETAHLRRWDHVTKLLAFLVCAVYWFHPLVWVCYILYCRDMEAACDERVVKDMDDTERRAYARALLSCEGSRKPRPFCPPAFGETDVKSRIKGVLSYKKPLLWVIIAAILILTALGVFLLTDPAVDYVNIPSNWTGIESQAPVSSLIGFEMHLADLEYSPGDRLTKVTMRFVNKTGNSIGYGNPFKIYREENGDWVDAAITDTFFELPMYHLEDGKETVVTYDVAHYDLSTPGRYLFTISITAPINDYGATKDYEVRWQFRVMEGNALASPRPDDFAIHFESQIGDVPNVLDTFDGYVQKDLVLAKPNKAKTDYEPTEAELQYLWYLVESHGVLSMPSDMHPVQTGDIHVAVTPNTEYTVRIRAGGYTYTIRGDTVTGMIEGEQNAQFHAFVGEMYNFMISTGQWKSLPDADGGYS